MFNLKMQTKTKWPGLSKVTRKNLAAESKPAGRAVLVQLRSALRSAAPVSRRKTESHSKQKSAYGTLKKQIGKISTLRVRSSYKKQGWIWRFKVGRGNAYWLHFLEAGIKKGHKAHMRKRKRPVEGEDAKYPVKAHPVSYPKNRFFTTTARRFRARYQSSQVAALRSAIKRSLAEARTTTI